MNQVRASWRQRFQRFRRFRRQSISRRGAEARGERGFKVPTQYLAPQTIVMLSGARQRGVEAPMHSRARDIVRVHESA
jgi:hypothetical protein